MKDEIKEILFLLHNDRLTESGKRKLEDYITNLQKENEMYAQLKDEYEDIIDKAKEYIKTHCLNANEPELENILNGGDDNAT